MLCKIIEFVTRRRAYKILPNGVDFAYDIKRRLTTIDVRQIIDAGANIGQSAEMFVKEFPKANIRCFEPVPEIHEILNALFSGYSNVICENLALSGQNNDVRVFIPEAKSLKTTSRIVIDDSTAERGKTVSVPAIRIDDYCHSKNINTVDILKIDVEGHERDVLAGCGKLLHEGSCKIIILEATLDPDNKYHTQLDHIFDLLIPNGYRVFGFYNQKEEFIKKRPHLRRFDCAFIHKLVK